MKDSFYIPNLPYNRRLFNKTIFLGSDFIEHKQKPSGSYYHFFIKKEEEELINNIIHKKITTIENDVVYFVGNQIHRENDLPAIIYQAVGSFWFKNNKPHRDNDLPAVIFLNGTKEWHYLGKIHRKNKPAITFKDSKDNEWFTNGYYHRDNDLPAKTYRFENYVLKKWYINGNKIRISNNPSLIIENTEYVEWYLNNKQCSKKEFEKYWIKKNVKYFK
jgi:hypothetical protein